MGSSNECSIMIVGLLQPSSHRDYTLKQKRKPKQMCFKLFCWQWKSWRRGQFSLFPSCWCSSLLCQEPAHSLATGNVSSGPTGANTRWGHRSPKMWRMRSAHADAQVQAANSWLKGLRLLLDKGTHKQWIRQEEAGSGSCQETATHISL